MVEFVVGTAVGIAGMIVKEKLLDNNKEQKTDAKQNELDTLYQENEKFRKRNKEMERQIEDLLAENQKLHRQYKDKDDDQDDLEDELQKAKGEVKKLRTQNDELYQKIEEYKTACGAYEIEIAALKNKLS